MTILTDAAARLGRPALPSLQPLWRVLAGLGRGRAERLELLRLDERMLGDIGLDRAPVQRELDRPFWRPVDWPALERTRR